jgi:hypothetical protein
MNNQLNQEQLQNVIETAKDQIELILSELEVNIDGLYFNNNEIRSKCFIHGGNNPSSFCFNKSTGFWCCYTKSCHENHKGILGLTQLLLSKKLGTEVNFPQTIKYLCDILNIEIDSSQEIDHEKLEISKLLNDTKTNKLIQSHKEYFKPFSIKHLKNIEPSWYFLEKGFSEETLKKFYIGFCDTPMKPMYRRSYAPVLDDDGKNVIGVSGRIEFEKCALCGLFHEQNKGCPVDNKSIKSYPKWQHYGFCSNSVVYNLWNIKELVKKTGTIILTEGPKDIWWLDQNGIYNSSCLFGLNISKYNIEKLMKNGVLKIILAMNNDPKGLSAAEKNQKVLEQYFTVINISNKYPAKDLAELSKDQIRELFSHYE